MFGKIDTQICFFFKKKHTHTPKRPLCFVYIFFKKKNTFFCCYFFFFKKKIANANVTKTQKKSDKMGVRGLKTYLLTNHAACGQEIELVGPWQDVNPGVVIDGNGLIHHIISEFELQIIIARNGGAYELFEQVFLFLCNFFFFSFFFLHLITERRKMIGICFISKHVSRRCFIWIKFGQSVIL